ncbi:hypothetical protein P6U16_21920 (plasmid) [Rhizobium sp. 32-5/1]|uniref:hypothetical protein n=1 Tax=Rhizobium sp. 32-5/1 TaxID=3019602 RepID=UPI00240D6500|nr:hypothetical protein [Rhizobium sp. 32-5/1]WEZ85721.1 hypothetical protein P6U16_21920 [Rhizobium sp. 32-5/1]
MTANKISRSADVLDALFILISIALSVASLVLVFVYGASFWLLVVTDVLLLISCRQAMIYFLDNFVPIIAATDAFGAVLLVVLLLIMPLFAPFALYWTIRRGHASRRL